MGTSGSFIRTGSHHVVRVGTTGQYHFVRVGSNMTLCERDLANMAEVFPDRVYRDKTCPKCWSKCWSKGAS